MESKMGLLSYSRDNETAKGIIKNLIAKNRQVIYGQQATNFQLPINLRRETKDYDILTKQPKKSAEELANQLNREYGKTRFAVIPANYSKTFKVKDLETGETVADYTRTTKKPKSINEIGVRYANLSYSERKLKKILKDEASSFRHEKDLDTLNRIRKAKNG